jgi:hypothetical protein
VWSCFLIFGCVWIVAGIRSGYTLELSDQNVRDFLVPVAFKRLFPEYAHKVFGEISVRL